MTKVRVNLNKLGASFRDPDGLLFMEGGELYRQVNQKYADNYDLLISSGLYNALTKSGRLIPHKEIQNNQLVIHKAQRDRDVFKILRPERIPFISYPYEWSFSQLKDAALATLAIQKQALKYGMTLKDASNYNIQFRDNKAVLIDTLSFIAYEEGEPWIAYRQFCQHFLAPLLLIAFKDVRLLQLLRIHIDGVPLNLASRLLPLHTWLKMGVVSHIHLHAAAQKRYAEISIEDARRGMKMSREALILLIESLQKIIRKLNWDVKESEWGDYYGNFNYTQVAFEQKKKYVAKWSRQLKPSMVWDLGANTGVFSREVSGASSYVISWDQDPVVVDKNWKEIKQNNEKNILPLIIDLNNPSPGIGWDNRERDSFGTRGPVDLLLALGIVHHLAISNNLPFERIADTMAGWGKSLIVEFIPKTDSQVKKLFRSRMDIFTSYNRELFEISFKKFFNIHECHHLPESERWIYLMESMR